MRRETLRKFSAILAAAVMVGSGFVTFADTPQPSSTPSVQDESGNAGTEPGTSEPQQPDEPQTVSVKISANYFDNGDGTYKIVFSSLDKLNEYKNFSFTVKLTDSYTGSKITESSFGDKLQSDKSPITSTAKELKFTGGSPETLVSGKLTLCTITVEAVSAPNEDKITFSDLKALDRENKEVLFAPVLSVTQGPVVPELNTAEKKIYDEIILLPSVDELSFYTKSESGEINGLTDINSLSDKVNAVKKDYDALASEQKTKISANLDYNEKSVPDFTALSSVIDAMTKAYDAVKLSDDLSKIKAKTDDNIANYLFIYDIFENKLKENITSEEFTAKLTDALKNELGAITASFETDAKTVKDSFKNLGYGEKLDKIELQLIRVQERSTDTYYNDYLSDVLGQVKDVKEKLKNDTQCSDRDKVNYSNNADTIIKKIESIQKGVSEMPKCEISSVYLNSSYKVTFTRNRSVTPAASVKVVVYNTDGNKIDEKTSDFSEESTTVNVSILASSKKGYTRNTDITLELYYIVQGAEFKIDTKTATVRLAANNSNQTSGGGSNISGGSSGSNSGSSTGGTKFPSNEDKTPTDVKPIEPEKTLFNDIANYDWAKDAIEGLYYAGVINGMDDGIFNPAGSITREQFCKMVVQLFGVLNYDAKTTFNDVKTDAWYTPYIASAINAGYIQGQSNEYFGVGESIMRQDMATILYRALGESNSSAVLSFTDTDSIAPYAKDAISQLVGLKIINGYEDGTFKPRGTATRAEAAKMIWGVYNLIKK